MSKSLARQVTVVERTEQETPPASPPLVKRRQHMRWRYHEPDIPDQFLGWQLIIRNADRMYDPDPDATPSLVIEEV